MGEEARDGGAMAKRKPDTSQDRIFEAGAGARHLAEAGPGLGKRDVACRTQDPEQEQVITAIPADRLVVEAGPGYGKTDVACARVAELLKHLEPTEILLLSFTRTAVREMRNRIQALAAAVDRAGHVSIRTLDSFNAEVRRLCSEATLAASYEDSITEVLDVLENEKHPRHERVIEALARFKHVLVDEAQDLVGPRSALVAQLLLRSGAGWTVFYDEAQAIYGWSETGRPDGTAAGTVIEEIERLNMRYRTVILRTLHRTANPKLASLQKEIRDVVTKGRQKSRSDAVRARLKSAAPKAIARQDLVRKLRSLEEDQADSTLVLYRTRAEALQLSHDLAESGVQHRLRLGRLPHVVAPWVAACLNQEHGPKVSEADFDRMWSHVKKHHPVLTRGWEQERAWRSLLRASLTGKFVEPERVADAIAYRVRTEELFNKEIGPGGPIVGTVHGSKGREADHVVTHFCREGWDEEDANEEARILYVGISRARLDLLLNETDQFQTGFIEGRAWKGLSGAGYLIEMGLPDDLEPIASCGAVVTPASEQQEAIASYNGQLIPVAAFPKKISEDWRWVLVPNANDKKAGKRVARAKLDPELRLGAFAPWMGRTLMDLARKRKGRNPEPYLFGLYWYDTTTIAVRADDPHVAKVPAPWRNTRMWLLPVVMGFGFGKTRYER